jgi:hypothetical protein
MNRGIKTITYPVKDIMSTFNLSRGRTIAYWFFTVTIALELALGGVWDILRIPYAHDLVVDHLGYPAYFLVIIGVWKVPGAVVLLAPRLPRLKEWVYAGAFFTYTGAAASHLAMGDFAFALGPAIFGVITLASWALRPAPRRDLTGPIFHWRTRS